MSQSDGSVAFHSKFESVLPKHRDLYYDGKWQTPRGGYIETLNPGTGQTLGPCAEANAEDVDAAVQSAHRAWKEWRKTKPLERAVLLRKVADVLRANAADLAMIDSANCGNPVRAMYKDILSGATRIELFAGLGSEAKGDTIPMGDGVVNLSVREPYGVCARMVAYNHPLLFAAVDMGAPLAAGNTVIIKSSFQAPLSAYRMMELIDGILPPGVLNILSCGRAGSEALVAHPLVPRLSLIGSVETGRAIAQSAAARLKHVTLELGGKNACIIYPDADLPKAARGAVEGMNFTWCGQSCGSTSRLFVHASVHDQVIAGMLEHVKSYKPGIPTEMDTTMGAIISKAALDKMQMYIEAGKKEGASLLYGGHRPTDKALAGGYYLEPTIFTDVTQEMRIAREERFGPVLSVIKWHDEEEMFNQVNSVDYGLTGAVWTTNLATAHRAAARIEAGYIWVNNVSAHFYGASFGGYKQSGIGRVGGLDELLSYTQVKNINITL